MCFRNTGHLFKEEEPNFAQAMSHKPMNGDSAQILFTKMAEPSSATQESGDFEENEGEIGVSMASQIKPSTSLGVKRKLMTDDEESRLRQQSCSSTHQGNTVQEDTETARPRKRLKADNDCRVWKWWTGHRKEAVYKWHTLRHNGPVFPPLYQRLPSSVHFYYDGVQMHLSKDAEEVATFYARMLDHEYMKNPLFKRNFFMDWKKYMTEREKLLITDLDKCDFSGMHDYFQAKKEERKTVTKETVEQLKQEQDALLEKYGHCYIDGHRQRIANFKIEPPGLFRGRGANPNMGKVKRRVWPEDVIINCSNDVHVPCPIEGRRWGSVQHDRTVTWLACWVDNVQGQIKYVMLNASSKLRAEKDWEKFELARKLAGNIQRIRQQYRADWNSKQMHIRQRATALYFIDKLALRAGNEKGEDQADTVGCCSLRVEHVTTYDRLNGNNYVVVFDFLGKDSVRYYKEVCIEKRAYRNLELFLDGKRPSDKLFDCLSTSELNEHLKTLMEGLTAKVFRTYNASITLEKMLNELTEPGMMLTDKIRAYNSANRAVAVLCNHQRAVPKTHVTTMNKMTCKINVKEAQLREALERLEEVRNRCGQERLVRSRPEVAKAERTVEQIRHQLAKLRQHMHNKEQNKGVALGTSKLNYLDPRIIVAWCKKHAVDITKVYNKAEREKFQWAIETTNEHFTFAPACQ